MNAFCAWSLRLHAGVCSFFPICTLRCLDRGISLIRSASLVPKCLNILMSWEWMSAVMGKFAGLKISLWAIFRLVGHLPLKSAPVEVQKRSVATCAPAQRETQEGGQRSRSKSSIDETDLRTVNFNKKALAKWSWCYRPRTSEGMALWGRVLHTSAYGARLSSVPSGDRSVSPDTRGGSGHSDL